MSKRKPAPNHAYPTPHPPIYSTRIALRKAARRFFLKIITVGKKAPCGGGYLKVKKIQIWSLNKGLISRRWSTNLSSRQEAFSYRIASNGRTRKIVGRKTRR